jgi:hypothetical protein
MDIETKAKIENALNEYFHKNNSIYNYPVELEGLKVNAEEYLELIEENYRTFWDYECSCYYPGERINLDKPTWEEILNIAIPKMEKQISKYEKLIKNFKLKK